MGKYDNEDTADDDAPSGRVLGNARGWGKAKAVKEQGAPFASRLTLEGDGDDTIIKFLEDEPYASYAMHWIERAGQKSWTCIDGLEEGVDCPLCAAGDRPSARFCLNVAELGRKGEPPSNKSWEVGPKLIDQISNFHTSDKTGPLTKNYVLVTRSGTKNKTTYNMQMVKERDLGEDGYEDYKPLTDAELSSLKNKLYDESIIPVPALKKLEEIKEEME